MSCSKKANSRYTLIVKNEQGEIEWEIRCDNLSTVEEHIHKLKWERPDYKFIVEVEN